MKEKNKHKEFTIDDFELMEHYPYKFYMGYLHTQDSLKNHPELQGLPTFDVYGLSYNEVRTYLLKKTEIRVKSEKLYENKPNGQVSAKNLILFSVCYVLAFIFLLNAHLGEDDRESNAVFAWLCFLFLVMPFIIRWLHKFIYVKRNDRALYNGKIETYLDVLSKYMEWHDELKRFNETKPQWIQKGELRHFTQEETDAVKEAVVESSKFGLSVHFYLKDGSDRYIPLDKSVSISVGQKIDLTKAYIKTLSKTGEVDIFRIVI